ncbi:hypothetical protein B7494_g8101 [Chlorociboria aeruginascens]|nr:hypothetical protein B7494_g8101 [Chlorociboria aeruginascens]
MMETATSFTARRSATSNLNLPTFQLPPPDHLSTVKYPAYAPSTSSQPTPAVAGHVLTPPAGSHESLSPLASSVNSGSSSSSAGGVPPYQSMGYWATPQNASYAYSSAPSMPAPYAQPNYGGRSLYSPPVSFAGRNPSSPATGEGLPPPPPYDINLPPFATSMPMSGQSLPSVAPQHQHQHQHQHQMSNSMMNSQPASSQAPSQGPVHAPENYGGRPPPTPTYYTPSSTPQQSTFPAYAHQSPSQHSPSTSAPSSRISPVSAQSQSSSQSYQPRPYSGYNLPAMAGPIMSNVHSPGNQMSLVGGMNMPYQTHQMPSPMYGHHPGQQHQQNDRPFKCDVCPQSFNRNHDLKRHKRIHLAVKPFPCGHCEKSFSRKDALKRHMLVKGCGKSPTTSASNPHGSQSPTEKDGLSDSADDSPELMKKEL